MCCEVLHVDQQEQALTESNMILYIYIINMHLCCFLLFITYIYHLYFDLLLKSPGSIP